MSISPSPNNNITLPWDAHIAPTQSISLENAQGRIAASTIRQYPPGIPDVIPGMEYTEDMVNILKTAHAKGLDFVGMKNGPEPRVDVTSEDNNITSKLDVRTIESCRVDDKLATEIADFFRLQFSAAPYYHYAFHESDPLQSLPQNLDYAAYAVSTALSDETKRRACQDTLRDMAYRNTLGAITSPPCESTRLPKGFHHWTDKEICRQQTKDRLSDPGYVTLIRDKKSKKLEGLIHARKATIKRLFYSEEWHNPHIFSAFNDTNLHANAEEFFEKIDYHFSLKPSDPVMTISAQILTPGRQGGDIFYDMMRSLCMSFRQEHARLPVLCEIPPYGTGHTVNTTMTDRIIFGVLKNEHPLVFCKQISQALFLFVSEKQNWNYELRTTVKNNRHFRTKYFIPLPSDNNSVEVRPNGRLGLAVFATNLIPKDSTIAVFTGERYRSETALGLPEIMRDHAIQVSQDEFVFGYKGLAHRVCHSCDPNCGIRNLTEIFAVRDIEAGEQITWDYRCSENSNWVLEECLCGTDRCTGIVKNHDSLPNEIKSEYLEKGMVSEWITSTK